LISLRNYACEGKNSILLSNVSIDTKSRHKALDLTIDRLIPVDLKGKPVGEAYRPQPGPRKVVAEGIFPKSSTDGGPKNITIRVVIDFWNVGAQVPGYDKARMELQKIVKGNPKVERHVLEGTFSGGPNGRFIFNDEDGQRFTFVLKDGRLILGEGYQFVVKNPEAFGNTSTVTQNKNRPKGGKSVQDTEKENASKSTSPIGRWRWFTGEIISIYSNGRAQSNWGNHGNWRQEGETVVIVWENGKYIDRLRLQGDRLSGRNQLGDKVWGNRIAKKP